MAEVTKRHEHMAEEVMDRACSGYLTVIPATVFRKGREGIAQAIADAESRGAESAGAWIPGDGTGVNPETLAWVAFGNIVGPEPYRRAPTLTGDYGWFTVNGHRFDHGTATHYMPLKLPAPPAPTKESK